MERKTLSELAFIALGSNIEPEKHLPEAVRRLRRLGRLLAVSSVYQNPALGPDDRPERSQPDFLNAAALVETNLSAEAIRSSLRRIEADLGRVRTDDPYAPRTIDLDLSLLGDRILKSDGLSLPDPDLLRRAHLAVPIAELAPGSRHPLTGERLDELADRLRSGVRLTARPDMTARLKAVVKEPAPDSSSDRG